MATKEQILKAIEGLPDDASFEDALERLYLLYKIEKGLRQADSGELISQDEARQRMAKWFRFAPDHASSRGTNCPRSRTATPSTSKETPRSDRS